MKISLDTKEDSHEEIRKVIKMLQNLVGDSQEIFSNQPTSSEASPANAQNVFTNLFGDSSDSGETSAPQQDSPQVAQSEQTESSESTEDLFAELFSEEELKKMDESKVKDSNEEEQNKTKNKKFNIELY
ncbi:MAG: hypothetical protein AABX33_03510 [Nanoarchaeota archaeon]